MIKAYRAFWTCQSTSGKTWGLKTNLLYWIHTKVIRPILTYRSMVRQPRVRYVSRMELNKQERLACLVITQIMRTTPTVAMDVHLGLPPLHVIIETRGPSSYLQTYVQPISGNPNPLISHAKVSGHGA